MIYDKGLLNTVISDDSRPTKRAGDEELMTEGRYMLEGVMEGYWYRRDDVASTTLELILSFRDRCLSLGNSFWY